MADPVPISLGRGSNQGRHGQEGVAQFINAYAERLGEGGKVQWPIYAINGLEAFATLTLGGAVRGMLTVDATLLIVSGRLLFSTNVNGTPVVQVGGIPSDGFVTMARNRQTPNPQVVIVANGEWFIYQGGTLSQGTDADLPPPICVVEVNGYFVFLIADGRLFASAIDDTTIDGLDFTTAQISADANVMGAVRGRELVVFGERSTEWYVESPSSEGFPFTRIQTASIGCYTAGSVAKIILQPDGGEAVDSVIWAATDHEGTYNGIRIMNGYTGTKISTNEIDRAIRDDTDPTSIRAFAWTEDAHSFYCISGVNFSYVWDSTTGQWHQRQSYGLNRWRPSCHAQIGQSHIFGDYAEDLLYRSDPTVCTDVGDPIIWQITSPPVAAFPSAFIVDALHIDALTGVGLVSDTDSDANPQLMISYSDDGGATFGGERQVDLGAVGQRHTSITELAFGKFDRNGVSFRVACSASVLKGVMDASIEVRKLKARTA
ncbi:MAG TPA: hypothetical protein VNM37_09775 [Candidatus Dormibacteraeota bacterium]|nr:hypothetical protein [Candidatus Dormibacteraeota bacterium]